ncbi:MAG: CGGC domain-containing protein [Thermodesulfobacteriota bacterium]
MKKVAIIRCEKNETRCPLTNCLKSLMETKEAFAGYGEAVPVGIFTCRCPGDNIAVLAGILKSKGAETIHFCTCMFAGKTEEGWKTDKGGFCSHVDLLMEKAYQATGLPCVKGSAHLPEDYVPETLP